MVISYQKFKAYDDRCGTHNAETYSFNNPKERDICAQIFAKDKSVLFIRKRDKKVLTWNEYWVTVHYGKHKEPSHKGWISYKYR